MTLIIPFSKQQNQKKLYIHPYFSPTHSSITIDLYLNPVEENGIIRFWDQKSLSYKILYKTIYQPTFLQKIKEQNPSHDFKEFLLIISSSLPFISFKYHTFYSIKDIDDLKQHFTSFYNNLISNPPPYSKIIDKETYSQIISFIINDISKKQEGD